MGQKRSLPTQKRSIEKYNQILHTGFNLIMKNGYHNTKTDDIAKAAGISTGIIYRYFSDKKDLLIAALNMFIDQMEDSFFKVDETAPNRDLSSILEVILDRFIKLHLENKDTHEELESLSATDPDIQKVYHRFSLLLIQYMKNVLPSEILSIDHLDERVYMCIQLMESFCHYKMKSDELDTIFMKKEVLNHSVELLLGTYTSTI